jgi:hypothetical protein
MSARLPLALAMLALSAAAVRGDPVTAHPPATEPSAPTFAEVPWPFHIDEWGTGRAFRCPPARCGAAIDLFLRAKVGFCNCSTGVADDDEIDRVGDTELFDGNAQPLAPGAPVTVVVLRGRTRPFRIDNRFAASHFVLEIALNNKCDAVVATAAAAQPLGDAQRRAVLAFLDGPDVQRWAADTTGSETQ